MKSSEPHHSHKKKDQQREVDRKKEKQKTIKVKRVEDCRGGAR